MLAVSRCRTPRPSAVVSASTSRPCATTTSTSSMFPGGQESRSRCSSSTPGRIYFDQGQYDKAIERYEEYLSPATRKMGPISRRKVTAYDIDRSFATLG